jgi:hypothetical protein
MPARPMPDPTTGNTTALLLQRLQLRLADEGRHVQAGMMGRLADRIASSPDVDAALRHLYAVQGWSEIALRLMWFRKRGFSPDNDGQQETLLEHQAEDLYDLLMTASVRTVEPEPVERTGALTGEVFEALHEFATALEGLRQASFEGEKVPGIHLGIFDSALSRAGRLHQAATAAGNDHLIHFAGAASLFLRYVIEREYFDDVRAVHLIDITAESLQKLLEQETPIDYAALEQSTDMLHNSETLLE